VGKLGPQALPTSSERHTRTLTAAAGRRCSRHRISHALPPTTSPPAGIRRDLRRCPRAPGTWAICAGREKREEAAGGEARGFKGVAGRRRRRQFPVSLLLPLWQRDCVCERVVCVLREQGCKRERGEGVCQFRPPRVAHHDRAEAAPQR
jgi:hypothetical protein